MISIGKYQLKKIKEVSISMLDITNAERNSKGQMFIDLIATKYKIEIEFLILDDEEMSELLNALKNITFEVTFISPQTGGRVTTTCYKGDRVMPVLNYTKDGKARYKDFKISLIEL